MLGDLKGKRAIVTGGATGIGFAIAARLAEAGVKVAIADIDEPAARAAADKIDGIAGDIDVRARASVEKSLAALTAAMGGLDILCANAGVSTMKRSST